MVFDLMVAQLSKYDFPKYLSWIYEIVEDRFVDSGQSSAPGSLLFAEIAGVSSRLGENSPLGQENDVLA